MEEDNNQINHHRLSFLKKNRIIIKAVFLSVFIVLILFTIAGGLFWKNRAKVGKVLISQYLVENQVSSNDIKIELKDELSGINSLSPIISQPPTQMSLVDVVKKTSPAVVSIIISKEVPKYEISNDPNQQIDPFGGMFPGLPNVFFNTPQYKQNGTEKKEVGGGSGFFVSSNGLIITNKHVVADTTAEYTVLTTDGKKYDAKVIARDPVLDIAVIKIESTIGQRFSYLEFGDSDKLDVGQSVIAIGNALGEFKNTVSVGIVSGLSRSVVAGDNAGSSELLDHVIQTDAAINPGNSGGPLLDSTGKVIGVNVAVVQGSQSIGFALPINTIKGVVESVKSTGKIVRPYIGIRYVSITSELKTKNNLTVDYGILVKQGQTVNDLAVIPGSPADKAGIVENDIILEINGLKINNDLNFAGDIRNKKIGDTVTLKILHKGEQKTVYVVLESAPQS